MIRQSTYLSLTFHQSTWPLFETIPTMVLHAASVFPFNIATMVPDAASEFPFNIPTMVPDAASVFPFDSGVYGEGWFNGPI